MTDTIEAPKVEPLPLEEIDKDRMFHALKWLYKVAAQLAGQVERGSADVHKTLPSVQAALHEVEDLMNPPPPPEAPEGVTPLFAHAVRPGDLVWIPDMVGGANVLRQSSWVQIRTVGKKDSEWVLWHSADPSGRQDYLSWAFRMNELFSVKRAKQLESDE